MPSKPSEEPSRDHACQDKQRQGINPLPAVCVVLCCVELRLLCCVVFVLSVAGELICLESTDKPVRCHLTGAAK